MFSPMQKPRASALLMLIVLFAGLTGCGSPTTVPTFAAPTTLPTADLQPTLNAVQTQAVQTVVANLTKNAPTAAPATATQAAPAATATQAPSATPAVPAATSTPLPPTLAPTATYVPWTLTPTTAAYSCSITEMSPKATDAYPVNSNFDVKWVIKNTGSSKWLKEETDVRYSTGTKMQKSGDILDLSTDVASGESYTVMIDMVAPATAGTYKASWVVITGKITICTLSFSINIQ